METTDPREVPGGMVGPGQAHEVGGVVLDARNAILLRSIDVSTVDLENDARGQFVVAMVLNGRINQTSEQASVLFLFGADGMAAILTELVGLAGRAGAADADEFMAAITERIETLRAEGNLS